MSFFKHSCHTSCLQMQLFIHCEYYIMLVYAKIRIVFLQLPLSCFSLYSQKQTAVLIVLPLILQVTSVNKDIYLTNQAFHQIIMNATE